MAQFHRKLAQSLSQGIKESQEVPHVTLWMKQFDDSQWRTHKAIKNWCRRTYWTKYFTAPANRLNMLVHGQKLRQFGLMMDDNMNDGDPLTQRALQLVPKDIKIPRFRRQTRAAHLQMMGLFVPHEEQNYDPFIPYMAPYVEEAKFQLQEELELLHYHPKDQNLYTGDQTGFGSQGGLLKLFI